MLILLIRASRIWVDPGTKQELVAEHYGSKNTLRTTFNSTFREDSGGLFADDYEAECKPICRMPRLGMLAPNLSTNSLIPCSYT